MLKKYRLAIMGIFVAVWVLLACNYGSPPAGETPTEQIPVQPQQEQQPGQPQPGGAASTPEPVLPTGEYKFFAPAVQGKDSQAGGGQAAGAQSTSEMQVFDPRVEMLVSADSLKVGETVTIQAEAVDIGLPAYEITLRDEGVQEAPPLVRISQEGQVLPLQDNSQILELVSASVQDGRVTIVLKAKSPGLTTVTVDAIGEAPANTNLVNGSGSGSAVITVSQ